MKHRFGDKSKCAFGADEYMGENIERRIKIEKGIEQIAVVVLHLITATDFLC